VRYADDFIVTGDSRELLEYEVRPLIEAFLNERRLRLSPEKTKVTHIAEGLDFFGQNVRSYNRAVLVTLSEKNRLKFLDEIRELITASKGASYENLIQVFNPVIRGWANYHRHTSAKRTPKRADTGERKPDGKLIRLHLKRTSATPIRRSFEQPEPDEKKPSYPVLRGGEGGNTISLSRTVIGAQFSKVILP